VHVYFGLHGLGTELFDFQFQGFGGFHNFSGGCCAGWDKQFRFQPIKLRRGIYRKTDLTAKYAKYAKAEATDSNFQTRDLSDLYFAWFAYFAVRSSLLPPGYIRVVSDFQSYANVGIRRGAKPAFHLPTIKIAAIRLFLQGDSAFYGR